VAEQEIAKHTKNVISLFSRREHGWRHKLGEIALEIITIVFAVSLSIWLHSLGEHHHEQEQVRTFLLGLRHDLQNDIDLIGDIEAFHHEADANFIWLSKLDPKAAPDKAQFQKAFDKAAGNFYFNALNSRYQGFKSSGKLSNIEDEALLDRLLNLYEHRTAQIKASEHGWTYNQETFSAYAENALDSDDDVARRYSLITAPKGKRLLLRQVTYPQLYERYDTYRAEAKEIIKQIDRLYPEAAAKEAAPASSAPKAQALNAVR